MRTHKACAGPKVIKFPNNFHGLKKIRKSCRDVGRKHGAEIEVCIELEYL